MPLSSGKFSWELFEEDMYQMIAINRIIEIGRQFYKKLFTFDNDIIYVIFSSVMSKKKKKTIVSLNLQAPGCS